MSDLILSGDDKVEAQKKLTAFLGKPNIVVEIVIGEENAEAYKVGQETACGNIDWKVVWVKNPALLTEEQLRDYTDNGNPKIVACMLGRNKKPCQWLNHQNAVENFEVEETFANCGRQE